MIKKLGTFQDFSDGTLKSVFDIGDNKIIEMSLLFNKEDKDVVCVPTHHYCNLGCKMCHLTNKGLNKSMVPIYYEDFIECLFQTLEKDQKKITDKKKLLISFMGVGEPLLNLSLIEEVCRHENVLKERYGYTDIGFSIATMMPNNNISKLKELVHQLNIPIKVHFSLHNPIDVERYSLIPSTNVSVIDALSYLIDYRNSLQSNDEIINKYLPLHTTNDPVEIHYTLIKGVNDGDKELNILCELLSKYKIPIKFIKFNPIHDLVISSSEENWLKELSNNIPGLRIKTYSPPGKEVGSSCGEFTKHYYHEEIESLEEKKEFENWKIKHLVYK